MISAEQLREITELVSRQGAGEALLTQLRAVYPGTHFTYCMDDDVHGGRPVFEGGDFRIYLVSSQAHCSQITSALENASGLVIAAVLDE